MPETTAQTDAQKDREYAKAMAQLAWNQATPNQKAGVRFGLLDVELFKKAGLDPHKGNKLFALALYECANADGGMLA